MTTQPQPLDTTAIQARADAATDGPWWNDGAEIYRGRPNDTSRWIGETCNIDDLARSDANGEFIAHARTDVPELIAYTRSLETRVAELEASAEALRVRLWLIEQALTPIDVQQDPAGIVGIVGPYLDGPIHPTDTTAYRAVYLSPAGAAVEAVMAVVEPELAALREQLDARPGCPDPIECDHEAEVGQLRAELDRARAELATARAQVDDLHGRLDDAAAAPSV